MRVITCSKGVFAVEWSFDSPNGAVTVRQEGDRVVCQAIRAADSAGLYKAWLWGTGEKLLLGTLIPEGGALRLRRVMDVSALARAGVWPPAGAEIAMAYAFTPEAPPPPNWCWVDCPGRLLEDPMLSCCIRGIKRGLLKRDVEGFVLALPWSSRESFPIPPLFCLARLEILSGRRYALFRFSRQGRPELLHNFSEGGENRAVI